jgi:ArsR family transcriptional regulator
MVRVPKDLYRLHAEVCKTLSNAKRLEILDTLRHRELSFGDIVARLGVPKSNVSQHLALMRNAGILNSRREGVNIYYRISSPNVVKACDLMREVLLEHHSQRSRVLKSRQGPGA